MNQVRTAIIDLLKPGLREKIILSLEKISSFPSSTKSQPKWYAHGKDLEDFLDYFEHWNENTENNQLIKQDVNHIYEVLKNEPPSLIAFYLTQYDPQTGHKILEKFPAEQASEVIFALENANFNDIPDQFQDFLNLTFKQEISTNKNPQTKELLIKSFIINLSSAKEATIKTHWNENFSEKWEDYSTDHFGFADIEFLNPEQLALISNHIDGNIWADALYNLPDSTKFNITKKLPSRIVESIQTSTEPESDKITKAQGAIVSVLKDLIHKKRIEFNINEQGR